MFRNATSRRHSELLTLGVAAEPQGERFALVIKGALAVWNVGIAFIVGTSTPPAFTSLERFAQWMIAARYTIIILHPSGRRSSGERPRRVQNQPKATTSAHTFRDGDVSQQDIFRLLLASCRRRSNCIEKLRPYSSDIGCHAKRFSRRDRDPVRR